jgi:hypothetical protein
VRGRRGRFITELELYDTPGHQDDGTKTSAQDDAWATTDRGTSDGTPVDGTSVDGTSVTGTSLRSTNQRSTKEEEPTEEHSSTLADARVAAADAAARDQEVELHRLYKAVNRLTPTDLGNALLAIEKNRPRIYRACRNDAIGQFRKDSPGILKAADAEREVDLLSYKYALKHYPPTKRPMWLVRPLAGHVPLESVRSAS